MQSGLGELRKGVIRFCWGQAHRLLGVAAEHGQFDPQRRGVCATLRERAKREIAAQKTNCLMLGAGPFFPPVTGTHSHGLSA